MLNLPLTVFPEFKDFNQRVRHPGGFRLPLPPTERIWTTRSGKAQFLLFSGLNEDTRAGDAATLLLTTIRSHDQYNTTIYGLDDRYRGVFGRRDVVFMNIDDMRERGIEHGDAVDIQAARAKGCAHVMRRLTAIEYRVARGSVAAYYPEANILILLDYVDPLSGTPSYKSVPVRISLAA